MSKYKIEQYLNLCALTYFDIVNYQKGMNVFDFIEMCFKKTDNMSVFFQNIQKYLYQQDLKVLLNLKIVDYINDNQKSGIVCYCFEDEEDCFIVFRGSELYDPIIYENGWKDWLDNLELFLGITKQQLKAYECFKTIHTNKKIHLIGHSKGGNLALFIGIVCNEERFNQISEIITFNACGFQLEKMNLYEERIQKLTHKLIIIENEMDLISSLFHPIKQPIVVLSNYRKKHWIDYYESHQIWGFKIIKQEFIICDTKKAMNYFKLFNELKEEKKKWLVKQCYRLSENKELLKRIQESIERWVIQNEKNQ